MKSTKPFSPGAKNLEVEVKIKVQSPRALRDRLLALGCKEKVRRSFEQNWTFDFADRRLRTRGQLLRLRRFAGRCSLTFKGVVVGSKHFKIREELETEVSNSETFRRILERLGLRVTFRYEKFRTSYSWPVSNKSRSVNLTLDETPIGDYLEIEGSEGDIERVAAELGYQKNDFIKESYLTLFKQSLQGRRKRHMLFAQMDREENP